MKRFKHNKSHYNLLSAPMGKLIPTSCYEVLPGSSVQQSTSALIRVSPLQAPVMHPIQIRFHTFFVPNRIIWDDWEDFITGGADGLNADSPILTTGATVAEGSPSDYMGVPPGTRTYQRMPSQAYATIWNEYYADQDLDTQLTVSSFNGASVSVLKNVAWEKDYFTSARPWSQKGAAVSIPLGSKADIHTEAVDNNNLGVYSTVLADWAAMDTAGASGDELQLDTGTTVPEAQKLFADLTGAAAADVNDVRRAFAIQRYQEARAQYGSRYTEYLRYLGVQSSDARLQRPEYLGGGKSTIAFSEVLRSGNVDADATNVGDMAGHGISAVRTRPFRRYFEEHGHVITCMSARPKTMYSDGQHKMYNRPTKEDYWQKELESIGQQEILNKEVYADHSSPDGVFGYQDRYAEYKHIPSRVSGEFRTTLDHWHLSRAFGSDPTLNAAFIACDPSTRIHADTSSSDKLWCMVNHNVVERSMVRKGNASRIL